MPQPDEVTPKRDCVPSGAFHEAALQLEVALASSSWPGRPPPIAPSAAFVQSAGPWSPQPAYTGANPYALALQSSQQHTSTVPPAVHAYGALHQPVQYGPGENHQISSTRI
jgi:hypothetical protein